jgi:hypothetical protein
MRRTVLVGLLLVTSPAVAGTLSEPILGGTPATAGQYPSVVALDLGGQALCTGTLIDKDWVLTAAHCLQGFSASSIQVHFNTVNINQSFGTVVGASMAIPKPEFNISDLGSNDIGLIKLARSVTDIQPTAVNLYAAKAPVGIKVTMVGFGATAAGGGGNIGVEYVVDQTSVSCSGTGGSDANLLCFNQVSGKGKCEGDSGGPSFAMIDGRLTQVGITSFGDQYCQQFGADTRTDAEKAFLLKYIPQLECTTDAECPAGRACFLHRCIAQPFGPGGLGSECNVGTDCDSGTCATSGNDSYCSMSCTVGDNTSCPDGLECKAPGACWPEDGGGCCDASGKGAPTMLFGMAFVMLMLRKRKR